MQWEDVLRSTFLQERLEAYIKSENQDNEAEDPSQGLELVASLSDNKLSITFRKSISGIHQKLGELSLTKDPDAGISLFDWALTLGARAETVELEADTVRWELAEQTDLVKRLNQQLEELIQAKKEHEDTLLQKCAVLLNEKKKKIRNQQRLLQTAKVSTRKFKEVQQNAQQAIARHRSPKPSESAKRKASAPAASSDEGDAFEGKDVRIEEREEEQPDSEQATPQHSDLDVTEDEVDDEDLDPVPAPSTGKGKVVEAVEANGGQERRVRSRENEDVELPPRRELPFRKDDHVRKLVEGEDREQDTHMADDDETDDDEL